MKFPKINLPQTDKRVLVIAFSFLFLIGVIVYNSIQLNALTQKIADQQEQYEQDRIERSADNTKLQKQNAELNKKTIFLANRGLYYSKCIARLISKYTIDQRPITIKNLYKCEVRAGDGTERLQNFTPSPPEPKDPKQPKGNDGDDTKNRDEDNPEPDSEPFCLPFNLICLETD